MVGREAVGGGPDVRAEGRGWMHTPFQQAHDSAIFMPPWGAFRTWGSRIAARRRALIAPGAAVALGVGDQGGSYAIIISRGEVFADRPLRCPASDSSSCVRNQFGSPPSGFGHLCPSMRRTISSPPRSGPRLRQGAWKQADWTARFPGVLAVCAEADCLARSARLLSMETIVPPCRLNGCSFGRSAAASCAPAGSRRASEAPQHLIPVRHGWCSDPSASRNASTLSD